jgi:Na+/H+ antiporter NhaC
VAVASLVLGILAILFGAFVAGFQWIGTIVGIIGIILGSMAKKNPNQNQGMAKAGLVCSIIGTILSLLLFIACVACVGTLAGMGGLL